MTLNLGYLASTGIFAALFALAVFFQIKAPRFHPVIYWVTIIATTTVGTTLADFSTRDLGIGYAGGSALLLSFLAASMVVWHRSTGSISVVSVSSSKAEIFYWMNIMFSQTLGTALGDWTADDAGFGYAGGALIFGGMLAVTAALYLFKRVNRTALFWTAFVITRPLGAVVGDFLDKPLDYGGLALGRFSASAVLIGLIAICLFLFKYRPATQAH